MFTSSTSTFRTSFLGALSLAVALLTSTSTALAAEPVPGPAPPRELTAAGNPLPDLVLPTGNELTFFPILNEGGEKDGLLIVEAVEPSTPSALEYLAEELGTALSREDILEALAGPESGRSGWARERFEGWAREVSRARRATPDPATGSTQDPPLRETARATSGDLACSNSWFNGWSWGGGPVGSSYFIRNDKTPNTYSGFRTYCFNPAVNGECWDKPRYRYDATWTHLTAWVGKICARTVDYPQDHQVCWTSSYGGFQCADFWPELEFWYYSNGWRLARTSSGYAVWSVPAGSTRAYYYRYFGSPRAWRLHVDQAKGYDQFDFLMNR